MGTPVFRAEISLGTISLILTVLMSIGAGIWEGSAIRATLESGLQQEAALRAEQVKNLDEKMLGLKEDVGSIRSDIRAYMERHEPGRGG